MQEKHSLCGELTEQLPDTEEAAYARQGQEARALRRQIAEEKLRWTKATAEITALKNDISPGKLVDREPLTQKASARNVNRVSLLMGLGPRLAVQLAGVTDPLAVHQLLESHITRIFAQPTPKGGNDAED